MDTLDKARASPLSITDFPPLFDAPRLLQQRCDGGARLSQMVDGVAIRIIVDGEVCQYWGQVKGGQRHGKGRIVTPHYSYEGDFQMGVWHGNGTFTDSEGYKYEGVWDDGLEVLSDGFGENPTSGDLAIYTNFFRLLTSDKGGAMAKGWKESQPKKILVEILKARHALKEMEFLESAIDIESFISRYRHAKIPNESLINLSRLQHCFLLLVQKSSDGNRITLTLLDSDSWSFSYDEGQSVETGKVFELEDPRDLIDVLIGINRCDDCYAVTDYIEQSPGLNNLPQLTMYQRKQKGRTCSLDCWLTALKFISSEREWLELRRDLFASAVHFHEHMSKNKGIDKTTRAKHGSLALVAYEKMMRRVAKLRALAE
jgi:hypothetical protein